MTELMKYKAFLCAAEYENITKAAQALGYTQSGVSQMIRALEDEAGFSLLMRSKHGVKLTEAGERLLPLVRGILNAQEKLTQLAADIRGLTVGELRIGLYSSVSTILPQILRRFVADFPDVKVFLHEGRYDEMISWLNDGKIDFFFGTSLGDGEFEFYPLKQEQMVAITPKNHPLSLLDAVPMQAFATENVIVPYPGSHIDVARTYRAAGVTPNSVYQIRGDSAIIAMVASGFGISLLPNQLVAGHESEVCIRPLSPRCTRTLGIAVVCLDNALPAAKRFIASMREFFERETEPDVLTTAR